jgi:hypothetical protein
MSQRSGGVKQNTPSPRPYRHNSPGSTAKCQNQRAQKGKGKEDQTNLCIRRNRVPLLQYYLHAIPASAPTQSHYPNIKDTYYVTRHHLPRLHLHLLPPAHDERLERDAGLELRDDVAGLFLLVPPDTGVEEEDGDLGVGSAKFKLSEVMVRASGNGYRKVGSEPRDSPRALKWP